MVIRVNVEFARFRPVKCPPLLQPYNDILERACRCCVESMMCVCYELMQTAGGHWGILADAGTPRPFIAIDFCLDHSPYDLQSTQPEPRYFDK